MPSMPAPRSTVTLSRKPCGLKSIKIKFSEVACRARDSIAIYLLRRRKSSGFFRNLLDACSIAVARAPSEGGPTYICFTVLCTRAAHSGADQPESFAALYISCGPLAAA